MNETQRQAYLQVMGIQPYFPRVPVPAARPSPQYDIAVPVTAVTHATARDEPRVNIAAPAAAPATRTTPSRSKPARAEAISVSPAAELPATPILSSALPTEPGDQLQFRLHYYRISNTLAVIDEVPFQQQSRAPEAVLLLLRAILQALGVNIETTALKADQFNWPLETAIDMKGDPALAAQQALLGYIAMRQQRDGFQQLLVFSAQLSTLLLEDKGKQARELARSDQLAAAGSHHITVTHSLQSLLAHPILKRETWGHLQALRQRLASSGN